jgi:hypothetical protein
VTRAATAFGTFFNFTIPPGHRARGVQFEDHVFFKAFVSAIPRRTVSSTGASPRTPAHRENSCRLLCDRPATPCDAVHGKPPTRSRALSGADSPVARGPLDHIDELLSRTPFTSSFHELLSRALFTNSFHELFSTKTKSSKFSLP